MASMADRDLFFQDRHVFSGAGCARTSPQLTFAPARCRSISFSSAMGLKGFV
jgi:hypothetical protein